MKPVRFPVVVGLVTGTFVLSSIVSAGAAALITGAQIKDGTITAADIKAHSLTGLDIKNGSLTASAFKPGVLLKGQKGDAGAKGANGVPYDCTAAPSPGVNLAACNLSRRTDLVGANLAGANLVGTDIRSVSLSQSTLTGANLTGADMQGATVESAFLAGMNLTDADLVGASFAFSDPGHVIYHNTICPDMSNSDQNGGTCAGHGGGL